MSSIGDDEAITLLSCDNEGFSISKVAACKASVTIKEMLEDTESDTAIPLPNVEGPILSKVIEFCTWHVGAEADGASEDAQNDYRAKFVEVDQGTLCHLIMAAIYLNIAPLVDLACKAVADTMKGKTPEEIRAHFSIQSDLTPEEEAQVRRENAWCEEDGRAEEEVEAYWAKLQELKRHRGFAESYIKTLAKFKPDTPNPEQQKVVENVRNYLKMFLILCDETREKPTVTPATRQSLIENNRQ